MGGEQGADGWTGRFPNIEGDVVFFKDGTVIGRDGKVGRESCVCVCFVYFSICLVVLFVFLFLLLLFELNCIILSVFN